MNQQITFRVGRGPRALSPAPGPSAKLSRVLFNALSLGLFWAMGFAAIILTVGVNPLTVK